MPAITVLRNALASNQVRSSLTANSTRPGWRQMLRNPNSNQQSGGGGLGGFLPGLLGKTVQFGGWVLNAILGGIGWGAGAIWGLIVSATTFIYHFNWNITDESIEAIIRQSRIVLSGMLGGTLGNAFGYLLCGVLPGAALFAFNEPLGLYVLQNVGEEALQELAGHAAALIQATFRTLMGNMFYSAYKGTRKAIKSWVRGADSRQKELLQALFGGKIIDAINNWGEKGSKPWSFAQFMEEKIESIQNPFTRAFVDEFYEEAKEACVEAGYVVANSIDSWLLQQQQQTSAIVGRDRTIILNPDREIEQERIILHGREEQLRTQLVSTMANYGLLYNRDVGQIIGEPVREWIRANPISTSIRILMRGAEKPPWMNIDGKHAKRVQITVPDVERSKLDWEKIKLAVGGKNGYMWGKFVAVAQLTNNRSLVVHAFSSSEAEERVIELAKLSEAEIRTVNVSERTNLGVRQTRPSLQYEPTRLYPAFMTIINREKVLNQIDGIQTTTGVYRQRQYLIPLYTDTKPDDFDEIIAELFRTGANPTPTTP